MKKRYIYSSILSGILFTVLYLVLNFNVFICLGLTVVTYIGGIFFFKENDVRRYDPNIIMHYCYLISKISNYANQIDNKEIKKDIKEIADEAEKVIQMLEQKPNKVTQVYDSFDYFIPLTIKVIEQYIIIKNKEEKERTKEEIKFLGNLKNFLDNIELEMKKLCENMNYTKMLDINSSIEVFESGNKIVTSGIIENEETDVEVKDA